MYTHNSPTPLGKPDGQISKLTDLTFSAERHAIADWLNAYVTARFTRQAGVIRVPHKKLLIDIYEMMMLDEHLSGVWANRKARVLGEEFGLFNEAGEKDEQATALLQASWFTDNDRGFISRLLDAKMYGYTLLELTPRDMDPSKPLAMPTVVDRRNTIPELRLVLRRPYDLTGYNIDDPAVKTNYVLAEGDGYGLLLKATPLTMYKRYALQSWVDHAEVFSQDLLVGTTDTEDAQAVAELTDRLVSAGRNRVVVKNGMEQVETISQSGTDAHRIYHELAKYVDAGNSKLVQGATGLSDIGTNYKEAGNHQTTANEIQEGDASYAVSYVNDELLPRLPLISSYYASLAGKKLTFKFILNRKAPLLERKALFEMLLGHYKIKPEHIKEEFGVDVEDKPEPEPVAAGGGLPGQKPGGFPAKK